VDILQQVVNGVTIGSVYGIVAFSLIVIFKATDIINFAQGEMVMIGAFIAFTLKENWNISFPFLFLITGLFSFFLGIALERIFSRRLIDAPILNVIIATLAVSMLLKSLGGFVFGHDMYAFRTPFEGRIIQFSSINIPLNSIFTMLCSVAMMAVLFSFFKYSKIGISMRATQQNKLAASCQGINIKSMYTLSWGISGLFGGIAGILIAPFTYVDTYMGAILLKSFAAAILGGFDSMPGAIVGGLIIGISESLFGLFFPSAIKESISFLLMFTILFVKPAGLFGKYYIGKI
jgi:branched-chain amino acid transport system permease protein